MARRLLAPGLKVVGDITKFAKLLMLAGVLLLAAFPLSAQDSGPSGGEAVSVSAPQGRQNQGLQFDENAPFPGAGQGQEPSAPAAPSAAGVLARMVVALLLVVVCLYALYVFLRRRAPALAGDDPFLRKVSSVPLAQGKSVQVVTLLDHAYILGVSDSSVNLIGSVDDKDLVDAMNLYADKTERTSRPRTFGDVLSIFMPGSSDKNAYDNAAAAVSKMMEQQRRRLSKEEEE